MKKSFLIFWLLLLFTLFNAYAESNYTNYSSLNTQAKPVKTANISTNIEIFQNLSTSHYDLASTSFSWGKQGGASGGYSDVYGVSSDNSGNSYVVGYTNVGLYGQIQNGSPDYLIVKYDANGYIAWSRQGGVSGGGTWGYGISNDNFGNVYITGNTSKGLAGQKQNGIVDCYIAKYDTNGNLLWTKQIGASGGTTGGNGVRADSLGNVYVTGSTNVGLSGQQQNGVYDYFVAMHNKDGKLIWTEQVGTANGNTSGSGISADNSGNIYITGSTDRGISGQQQNGFDDYFIAMYDIKGNLIWTRQVGAYGGQTFGTGISTDNLGNTYVTGWTSVGISGQKQNGARNYYVAKYDKYGLEWTTQGGNANGSSGGYTYGQGISADNNGNIYVAGYTNVALFSKLNGYWDYFIAKYVN